MGLQLFVLWVVDGIQLVVQMMNGLQCSFYVVLDMLLFREIVLGVVESIWFEMRLRVEVFVCSMGVMVIFLVVCEIVIIWVCVFV